MLKGHFGNYGGCNKVICSLNCKWGGVNVFRKNSRPKQNKKYVQILKDNTFLNKQPGQLANLKKLDQDCFIEDLLLSLPYESRSSKV